MRSRVTIAMIAGLAIAAMIVGARLVTRSTHDHQTAGMSGRMVLVSRSMPSMSRPGQPLHVKLISAGGSFQQQVGVVLTDKQCQPDGAGISHCLNAIRLASGQTITVRHPHRMSDVPCLTPGEHVSVRMTAA
jgi:hypothetical protein